METACTCRWMEEERVGTFGYHGNRMVRGGHGLEVPEAQGVGWRALQRTRAVTRG